jgi:hypothetical protein
MEEIAINLEHLANSRKNINTGDIFVLKPKGKDYYYGVVANANSNHFGIEDIIHIQIFNYCTEQIANVSDSLYKYDLLLPPILTNKLGWRKGYFKTIGHSDIKLFPTVKRAAFVDVIRTGYYFDDKSNPLDKIYSIETTGAFSIKSYLNIDTLISLKLGIPLPIEPPENWNPYYYLKNINNFDN